jgi:hypothetical protein
LGFCCGAAGWLYTAIGVAQNDKKKKAIIRFVKISFIMSNSLVPLLFF